MDLPELEQRAATLLPAHVYDYFRATAGGPAVLTEQVAAWEAIRHRPRVLRDTSVVDTATTVLSTPVSTPVLVAPMAQQVAAHPRGERETAAATAAAGSILGVSTNTAVPFAEVAATGAPWWFQLYVLEDRRLTETLLDSALAAGASALILTVDVTGLVHPRPGAGYSVEPTEWPASPAAERLTANLPSADAERARGAGGRITRTLGFDAIGYLHERTGLPVVVKGVLRGDDARRAVDAGAAAVLVSTHGARGLATAVPTARALAEVVESVRGSAEVFVDSGIRSGSHVASALALGARAVFVGRPAMWGLAVSGADGVRDVLDGLTAELAAAMNLLGAPTVADLTDDLIWR